MSANPFSEMYKAIAPALGNHLWQSTLFAVAAGLLTLALRNNHARIRYALWMMASAKFLIPFSLLSGLGSRLAWWRGSSSANAAMYIAMDQFGQPFSQPALRPISAGAPSIHSAGLASSLPLFLAVAWFFGIVFVVLASYMRWRRISAAVRKAMPVREGRELESLRRLERATGMPQQIEIRVSPASMEPGIFGIVRPVLVWPDGISARLDDAHLDAILAHELCHIRRRDNLTATVHMMVEAIFWFHPMVWWMGTQLLEERERACDEQVLELGGDRQVYAESILKICEFCVGSPLDFVSGVTGADLKKRIVNIMRKNAPRSLNFSKKLLLGAAGLASMAVPLAFGLLGDPHMHAGSLATAHASSAYFEVVSVQASPAKNDGNTVRSIPGRLTLGNWTTRALIVYAYDVGSDHVSGAPDWINSERYDIDANVDDSLAYDTGKLIEFNVAGRFPPGLRHDQLKLAVQAMLGERFKLRLHHETKQVPVYALVVAKSGPKLHEAKPDDTYANGIIGLDGLPVGPHRGAGQNGHLTAQALPMSNVAMALSQQLNCTVLNKTGLTGDYDFTLEWKPEENPVATGASIFSAIEQQLGLRLELQEVPTDFLLIDHIEKPVEPVAQNSTGPVPSFRTVSIKANTTDTPMAGFKIKGNPFSAAMFKPDRFMATNFTLHGLIRLAYGVQDSQIAGGPDWVSTEKYDVDARLDRSVIDELNGLGVEQGTSERLRMIQSLLADHFKLALHRETRDLPAYTLVLGDGGSKLQAAKPGDTYPNGFKDPDGRPVGTGYFEPAKGKVVFQGRPLSSLVQYLSDRLGRAVVDRTGLAGNYDFALQWAPTSPELSSPSILAAVQEQLGLRLDAQNTPTEVLVIERAEKPSEK
jgi:bla regulator protein blaR1